MLLPSEPDNYYETREIVPPDMLPEIARARRSSSPTITPSSIARRWRCRKIARSFLQGHDPRRSRRPRPTAQMLERACGKLLNYERVIVINDEAHHCYRDKVGGDVEERADRRRQEGGGRERGSRAALDQRHRGARPQAVERRRARSTTSRPRRSSCAARAIPRAISSPGSCQRFLPDGRDRERHRQAAARAGQPTTSSAPTRSSTATSGSTSARTCRRPPRAPPSSALRPAPQAQTGLTTLYSHYADEFERWERAGIGVPPVFIVVCNNTSISKLVYEWISGFERGDAEEGERAAFHRRPSEAVPQLRRTRRPPRRARTRC